MWLNKLFNTKHITEVEDRNRLLITAHTMDKNKMDILEAQIDVMHKFQKSLQQQNKVLTKALEIMTHDMITLQNDNEELQAILVRALK